MMLRTALLAALLATVHGLSDDYDPVNSEFLESVHNVLNPTPAPSATCSDLSDCDSTDFQYTLIILNFPGAAKLRDVVVGCVIGTFGVVTSNGYVTLAGSCDLTANIPGPNDLLSCQPDECGGNIVINICCPQTNPCLLWSIGSSPSFAASVFVATNPPVPLTSSLADCANGPGNTVNCVGNPLSGSFSNHCPPTTDAPTESPTFPPTFPPVPPPPRR